MLILSLCSGALIPLFQPIYRKRLSHFDYGEVRDSEVLNAIIVIGNFSDTADVYGWCSGNGTPDDPYTIADVVVDGQNASVCITIKSTSESFIIRNCTIYNSTGQGIKLDHARNGTIEGCRIYDNLVGVGLTYTENITITNNFIHDNEWYGVGLTLDTNLTHISDNLIYSNGGEGVYASPTSRFSSFINNSVYNNLAKGLYLTLSFTLGLGWNESNCLIINNSVHDNAGIGISVTNTRNCTMWNNSVYNNRGWGIDTYRCNDSVIFGNTVYNNSERGIHFFTGGNTRISNNTIYENGIGLLEASAGDNVIANNTIDEDKGMKITDCLNTTINKNTVLNFNDRGIYVWQSDNTTIQGNVIHDGDLGIYFFDSGNNTISDNWIYNNGEGIRLTVTDQSAISNNTIYNNTGNGIFLGTCNNNSITSNNISFNGEVGINMRMSDHNTITNNTLINNTEGITLDDSWGNTIANNTIQDLPGRDNGNMLLTILIAAVVIISVGVLGALWIRRRRKRRWDYE